MAITTVSTGIRNSSRDGKPVTAGLIRQALPTAYGYTLSRAAPPFRHEKADRRSQEIEAHSFFLGVLDFLQPGTQFGAPAPEHDRRFAAHSPRPRAASMAELPPPTQLPGRSAPAVSDPEAKGLHQISRVRYSLRCKRRSSFLRNVHQMWKTGAGTQEDGLKSLREQFLYSTRLAHDEIRAKFTPMLRRRLLRPE